MSIFWGQAMDFSPYMIAVVGIVMGCGLCALQAIIRHRERMAMIKQGLDPDHHGRLPKEGKPVKKPNDAGTWSDYEDSHVG